VIGRLAFVLLLVFAAARSVAAVELGLPVDCTPGRDCFIQNYVDNDPGPGRRDYACGPLSYDGHVGTDFRVPDRAAMLRGVAVVAAAPGVVRATRDGMADISIRETGREAVAGREAGNSVLIDHGDGWETQYSHLRRDSVRVHPGDRVKAGAVLGLIGLSGLTEFPHVHFEVRHKGRPLDPFVGSEPVACGASGPGLWRAEIRERVAYQATGGLAAGFAGAAPEAEAVRRGEQEAPTRKAPAWVFWVDLFGVTVGDEQRFRLVGPDGAVLVDSRQILAESKVAWFAFTGKRTPAEGWAPGSYRGDYVLTRAGTEVVRLVREVELR
jgi:murein DD-endopeptidase MepM/ murein hydrolase activator NlpD